MVLLEGSVDRWAHSILGTGRVGCIPELVGVVTSDLSRFCPGGAGRVVIWNSLFKKILDKGLNMHRSLASNSVCFALQNAGISSI